MNVEFHELLARAARNNALLAHYRGVVNQLDLYRRATISRSVENIPLSTQEHEAIVEAVAARDEQRAEAPAHRTRAGQPRAAARRAGHRRPQALSGPRQP